MAGSTEKSIDEWASQGTKEAVDRGKLGKDGVGHAFERLG